MNFFKVTTGNLKMQMKDIEEMKKKLKESYEKFISKFNFNDYLDRYMFKLKDRITEKIDPLLVEPTETTFEYRGWFYSFQGFLTLTNTKLHQLFNITRTGSPRIEYANNQVLLSWQMMFPEMTSDYTLHIFNKSKKGEVTAKVKDLLADVEFNCDVDEMKTTLKKIKLMSNGPIDIKLEGGEVSDAVGSVLLKAIAKIFKGEIMKNLEEAVKENIEEALDGVHLLP